MPDLTSPDTAKLRAAAVTPEAFDGRLFADAADEIDRLRPAYEASVAHEAVLRAENERLRVKADRSELLLAWLALPIRTEAERAAVYAALTEGTDPDAE